MHIDPQLKEELKQYLVSRMNEKQVPHVTIRSAHVLSVQDITLLKQQIEILDRASIVNETDPSLLAGLVIQFGSNIIDLSLRTKLQTLAYTLYETA